MNETTASQVTATLPNGTRLTHDFDSQSAARESYTNAVKHNTDGRILTISRTASTVRYRIHVPQMNSTEYIVFGSFPTQEEAEAFLAENYHAEGSYVVKETRSTTVESTTV